MILDLYKMAKEYIGSDEHWTDSVNQRYDELERYYKQMEQEQVDDRVHCQITNFNVPLHIHSVSNWALFF